MSAAVTQELDVAGGRIRLRWWFCVASGDQVATLLPPSGSPREIARVGAAFQVMHAFDEVTVDAQAVADAYPDAVWQEAVFSR